MIIFDPVAKVVSSVMNIGTNSAHDIACSLDSKYMTILTRESNVLVSTNRGETFVKKAALSGDGESICMSRNGMYQVICTSKGLYVSISYGDSWMAIFTDSAFMDAICSPDGKTMFACDTSHIYKSDTYGETWHKENAEIDVTSIALSEDGKLICCSSQGLTVSSQLIPLSVNAAGDEMAISRMVSPTHSSFLAPPLSPQVHSIAPDERSIYSIEDIPRHNEVFTGKELFIELDEPGTYGIDIEVIGMDDDNDYHKAIYKASVGNSIILKALRIDTDSGNVTIEALKNSVTITCVNNSLISVRMMSIGKYRTTSIRMMPIRMIRTSITGHISLSP